MTELSAVAEIVEHENETNKQCASPQLLDQGHIRCRTLKRGGHVWHMHTRLFEFVHAVVRHVDMLC